jgi:hypothetical protein
LLGSTDLRILFIYRNYHPVKSIAREEWQDERMQSSF